MRTQYKFIDDTIITQLRMSDGSLCSLLYTSQGHPIVGKERIELFFDGKTIILDDFITLQGYGLPLAFNRHVSVADRGHQHLFEAFFAALHHSIYVSPISYERIIVATRISIIAAHLARQGGGETTIVNAALSCVPMDVETVFQDRA